MQMRTSTAVRNATRIAAPYGVLALNDAWVRFGRNPDTSRLQLV